MNQRQLVASVGVTAFILGVWLSPLLLGFSTAQNPGKPMAPAGPPVSPPGPTKLAANLWMQSAEYRACCIQTYRLATKRLIDRLKEPAASDLPPAVVMDLDETVIDNSPFAAFMDREGIGFDEKLWEIWERDLGDEVRLVPGAKAFIKFAESSGVAVIYISNRLERLRTSTTRMLERLDVFKAENADRLMLRTTGSDKTARRAKVDYRYRVLIHFGDNLRDFSEEFAFPKLPADDEAAQLAAIEARNAQVEQTAGHFGTDWFILPNPSYGEWERALGPQPIRKLPPSAMKRPAK